jgi:hypothetical protein
MSALYLPRPYPDELLYSVFARFQSHLGMQSPARALSMLFGRRSLAATTDLSGRLGRLTGVLGEQWQMAPETVARRFTLLPYYTAFLSRKAADAALAALASDAPSGLHTRLGICASKIKCAPRLRFCGKCFAEDVERYGESYWHRSHQLPGVLVCPEHGEALQFSCASSRPAQSRRFAAADTAQCLPHAPAEQFLPQMHERLIEIARRSTRLLETGDPTSGQATAGTWAKRLREIGYGSRHGDAARLEADFVDHFGAALLEQLGCGIDVDSPYNWLRTMRRHRTRNAHPLRHILLRMFIEARSGAHSPAPFGSGPWPCLNRLASHYGKHVITDVTCFHERGRPASIVGRFSCKCGFVYTRAAGDQGDTLTPRRVVRFGPLFEKRARELARAGQSTGAIAAALSIDWKTAAKLATTRDEDRRQPCRDGGASTVDRQRWMQLLAAQSGVAGARMARNHDPALYARLYRRDRAWLLDANAKSHRQHPRPHARVDWLRRDARLAENIALEAQRVQIELPRRRITRALLAARLGRSALIEKKLDRLPQVRAALAAHCEAPRTYRVRKLAAARDELGVAGAMLSRSKLLRVAGIRSELDPDLGAFLTAQAKQAMSAQDLKGAENE